MDSQSPLERTAERFETALTQFRLLGYVPYSKQAKFHADGAWATERVLSAGNQQGKTHAGSREAAFHATGLYPPWWKGRRFAHANYGWACGLTNEVTRDIVQAELLGEPGQEGTGAIPAHLIVKTAKARGIMDALDYIHVRHVTGGISTIKFKSYEQGRKAFQGKSIDWAWCDEESEDPTIYSEIYMRTAKTGGCIFMTFTPLQGITDLVSQFYPQPSSKTRSITTMTDEDALHFQREPERWKAFIDNIPEHERDARLKGVPFLGAGLIFKIPDSQLIVPDFRVPRHWKQIGALDFGWDHPFAAVKMAWDEDSDVLYISRTYKRKEALPEIHAATLREWGSSLPWAWPHDGNQHESGVTRVEHMRRAGLRMLDEHAQFADGSNRTEPGITMMRSRMETGRWKLMESCAEAWLAEKRQYHRKIKKEGRTEIVRLNDDLISASRYGMMMIPFGRTDAPAMIYEVADADYDPLSAAGGEAMN